MFEGFPTKKYFLFLLSGNAVNIFFANIERSLFEDPTIEFCSCKYSFLKLMTLAKPTGTVINPPKQTTEDIFLETIIGMT